MSPNDRKINYRKIAKAVKEGKVGESPDKRGRPCKIPEDFCKAVATHSTMMQVSGQGEASKRKLLPLIEGLKAGTDHEFTTEWAYRKTVENQSALMMPGTSVDVDDRRVEWLTFKNINQMMDMSKKEIIGAGMAKDKRGMIRKLLQCTSPC